MSGDAKEVTSFISFDVEALPGRAESEALERLVWGQLDGGEYGIRRLSKILGMHGIKGNFLIDFAMCLLYGDKAVQQVVDFLLAEGHEVHAHLHSEWVVRKWGVRGDWQGPLGLDRTNESLSQALLEFTAWKYRAFVGREPCLFRSGGYLFSDKTIAAAKKSGFTVLSNYNSTRHASMWQLPECAAHNEPFSWDNQLLELPVDFSPEPLSFDWTKYIGWYDRARTRKSEKTYNLVLHSWSLLSRTNQVFDAYAPEHEERLHQICEHLVNHTRAQGYAEYLSQRAPSSNPPRLVEARMVELRAAEVTTSVWFCSICGFGFTKRPESDICPGCSSRARHRQVKDVLSRLGNPFDGKIVLANYANRVEMQAFLAGARSVLNFDVRPVSEVELQLDVQNMSVIRDGTMDAFLAMHVLNHVRDDEQALREIARVLKPGGVACLTIPYRDSYTTTAFENTTEHYGKEALSTYGVGTFRRYGLDDAKALFAKYFDVDAQGGLDPVTGESMLVFLLRKPGKRPRSPGGP